MSSSSNHSVDKQEYSSCSSSKMFFGGPNKNKSKAGVLDSI